MSVVIKGMQMPKNCTNCGLMCALRHFNILNDNRPSNCPLVEIPEHHGQLIDRDALSLREKLKLIEEREIQIYGGVSWSFAWCIAAIEDAPTIIEAEGADK